MFNQADCILNMFSLCVITSTGLGLLYSDFHLHTELLEKLAKYINAIHPQNIKIYALSERLWPCSMLAPTLGWFLPCALCPGMALWFPQPSKG